MIIDGSYLLHRQLHQPEIYGMVNDNGEHYGGVFGFLRSFNKEILTRSKYFPVVVFDHGLSPRRVELDQYYKHADERDTEIKSITSDTVADEYITQYRKQRNKLVTTLSYFGVPAIMITGWEGDDLIYILTQITKQSIVLTDDKDMLQLLSENVDVRRPMAKEKWTLEKFLTEKNYTDIYDFVIYKAVLGDESDNIPSSCKGVGDKYSNALIKVLRHFCKTTGREHSWYLGDYPQTEFEMKELCESLDVPYRKAFLNLDKERFCVNIGLVDLGLVEWDYLITESISSTIMNSKNYANFFTLMNDLHDMGINEVPVDTIIESVSIRRQYLTED